MAKLECVTVIETTNFGIVCRMEVFSNDLEGAGEAETLFKEWATQRGCDVNSLDDLLASGYSEAEGCIISIIAL